MRHQRMRAGRAGGRHRRVRPLGAESDRYLPGGEIDNRREDEEWRDAIGSALEQDPVLALDDLEPADAAADGDSDAGGVVVVDPRARWRSTPSRVAAIANWMKRAALLDVLLVDPVRADRSPSPRRRSASSGAPRRTA